MSAWNETVKLLVSFIYDSPFEYAGFFTAFRMTFQGFFVILNESPFFCHSERAFGRGGIPTVSGWNEVVKLLVSFIYVLPNENMDSSLSFRMTFQGLF